jgi:hypothetical protein
MIDRDPRLVIAELAARVESLEIRTRNVERALAQVGFILSDFLLVTPQNKSADE